MKTTLKKILLISLLFSATVPSFTVQANSLDKIAVEVGAVVGTVFVWEVFKEYRKRKLEKEARQRDRQRELNNDFWSAIESNNIEGVKQALANGADVNEQNENGDTALMKASDMGHFEIVKLLLENNALVNKENKINDLTALMKAAYQGHLEVVELLLAEGAEVHQQSKFGHTALMSAAANDRSKVVELLLANGNGVDINQQDRIGYTALMVAAWNGNPEVVKLLLATKKVDINQQDKWGETALMEAAAGEKNSIDLIGKQKFTNIIEQLLAAGADPLVKAEDGTAVWEQTDNETINEYMRKQTSGPLKEAVVALPGLLELPAVVVDLTLKLIYPECEPAQ